MKAFLNPLLLVASILLLAFGYISSASGGEDGGVVETWVLTLCLLGVIINGTLGVARALTRRPSVQSMGWAVAFLIFGCVVWALVSGENTAGVSSQERAALHLREDAWRAGRQDPWALDENGDCVLVLAAGLGHEALVADLLEEARATGGHADVLVRAAHRAAARNREQVMRLLLAADGVGADARLMDMTLLHTAALSKARRAAACLLELGANPNVTTVDGSTPLHHAVLAEDVEMVRLLLQHGADAKKADADGRDAASYARTEGMMELLSPTPAPIEN